jgi:hypothetical protein
VRVGAIFLEVSSLTQDRDGRELSSSRNGNEAKEDGLSIFLFKKKKSSFKQPT